MEISNAERKQSEPYLCSSGRRNSVVLVYLCLCLQSSLPSGPTCRPWNRARRVRHRAWSHSRPRGPMPPWWVALKRGRGVKRAPWCRCICPLQPKPKRGALVVILKRIPVRRTLGTLGHSFTRLPRRSITHPALFHLSGKYRRAGQAQFGDMVALLKSRFRKLWPTTPR